MGLILFLTAGTTRYWQGWIYLVVFFACAALTTIYVIRQDPALLERRMSGGPTAEERPVQKVYKANTFASATIELAANQTVISTGPYSIVRHPMYASALLLLIGTPLALGSYWGLTRNCQATPTTKRRLATECCRGSGSEDRSG